MVSFQFNLIMCFESLVIFQGDPGNWLNHDEMIREMDEIFRWVSEMVICRNGYKIEISWGIWLMS